MLYRSSVSSTLFTLLVFAVSSAFALAGGLDPSFGVGGRALASLSQKSADDGHAIAYQPDGRLIIAAESDSDSGLGTEPRSIIVTRWNSDGSIDTTFGSQGRVTIRIKTGAHPSAVRILTDGKILIGGWVNLYVGNNNPPSSTQRGFLFARLLPSGANDTSFGSGGRITYFPDAARNNTLSDLILLPDGKFMASGYSGIAPSFVNANLVLTRYHADGSPDNSFDGDGVAIFNVPGAGPARGNSLALQPDGKIVVGGSLRETSGGTIDFLFVRFSANGMLDTSFDSDGWRSLRFAGSGSTIARIAIQSDGQIVAAGNRDLPFSTNRDFLVARLDANGTPDSTFDGDGMLVTDVLATDVTTGLGIQSDGKIVVSGHSNDGNTVWDFVALRYNTNGSPDNSFDSDGRATVSLGGADFANAMLIEPGGKIVLAGLANVGNGQILAPEEDLGIVRLNGDGSLDATFDGDGKVIGELANGADALEEFVVQPDGKIVAGGYAFTGWVAKPAFARFNPDGSLDTSFGDQGRVLFPSIFEIEDAWVGALTLQADGKIVFTVNTFNFEWDYVVGRLNADGSLDGSFGNGGFATVAVGSSYDEAGGIVVQPDGKIVASGWSQGGGQGPSMIRLHPAGTLDPNFGSGGKVFTTSHPNQSTRTLNLQADGKLVLSGNVNTSGSSDILVRRYHSDGTPDMSFNGTGWASASVGSYDSADDAAIQPDGKIVVTSFTDQNSSVVRFNSNGSPDNSFGTAGKVFISGEGDFAFQLRSIALQADGKLVLAGTRVGPGVTFHALVYRLMHTGGLDTSFGASGRVVIPLGEFDSGFNDIDLQIDGKILAGGFSSNGLNDDFTIVRIAAAATNSPFDFDGDGKTDIAIFRPSAGEWWINRSGNGSTFAAQFGNGTDRIVSADYTGDGKADIAFWRPSSGEWFVLRSEDFSFYSAPFGTNGDTPVPADYDNDGKADIAVFRPPSATWFISRSTGGTTIQQFGANGDLPVSADYDGDGIADLAIFRPSSGHWWLNRSTAGVIVAQFGASTDKLVQGDYTGDGKADVAFWKPSTGEWYVLRSEDFSFYSAPFGASTDLPAPGDYDGDGRFDFTVFRPSTATWFSQRTTAGTLIQQFGANGDLPVANAFVQQEIQTVPRYR